jgi:hypothetical protein
VIPAVKLAIKTTEKTIQINAKIRPAVVLYRSNFGFFWHILSFASGYDLELFHQAGPFAPDLLPVYLLFFILHSQPVEKFSQPAVKLPTLVSMPLDKTMQKELVRNSCGMSFS